MWFNFALLCLILSGNFPENNGDIRQNDGKENNRMMSNIYPVIYSDYRRSSYIDLHSSAIGEIGWEKALNKESAPPFTPKGILMAEEQLFIYSDRKILSFNFEGEKLWDKEMRVGSGVWLDGDKVYFRKRDSIDELDRLFFNGDKAESKIWILDSDEECNPVFIEPLVNKIFVLSLCIPPPEQGTPMSIFYSKEFDSEDYIWVTNFDGESPNPPLHIAELNRFVVFSENEIITYNDLTYSPDGEEKSRFDLPVAELRGSSADKDGQLYLLGIEKNQWVLVCCTLEGEEKWRWSGTKSPSIFQSIQAPIIGVERNVHIVNARSVLTINGGQQVRQYNSENEFVRFCSSLADGSLLVSANRTLMKLNPQGFSDFEIPFEDQLFTPPVIDPNGNIYTASSTKIFQIK